MVVRRVFVGLGTFGGRRPAYGGAGNDGVVVNGTSGANAFTLDADLVTLNGIARAGHGVNSRRSTPWAAATPSPPSAAPPRSTAATLGPLDRGHESDNRWHVTAQNEGNLNGVIFFTRVEILIGGAGVDVFHFADGVGVGSEVDGGGSDQDELDYSAGPRPSASTCKAAT